MTSGSDWPRIAVVGAGAVGCYFGGLLARAGAPAVLIGRKAHVDAINQHGLVMDTLAGRHVVRIHATTDLAATAGSQVVLVSVKTPDTESTALALAPYLSRETAILSLQNGVNNAERMHEAANVPALAAAVYVAVQMVGPGQVKHTGRGDMAIGDPLAEAGVTSRRTAALDLLDRILTRAQVPCRISENVRAELWTKLAMNCAFNAISALTSQRYGAIARDPACRNIVERVIEERVSVAAKLDVMLSKDTLMNAAWRLGMEAMPDALSSTAQDLMQGKRTEIDSLNGHVAQEGNRLGVATPTNRALYALVKLAEQNVA